MLWKAEFDDTKIKAVKFREKKGRSSESSNEKFKNVNHTFKLENEECKRIKSLLERASIEVT